MALRKKKTINTNITVINNNSSGTKRFLFLLLLLVAIFVWAWLCVFNLKRNTFLSHSSINPNINTKIQSSNSSIIVQQNAGFYPEKNRNQPGPYHNWDLFQADFQEMLTKLKIFVYPDIHNNNSSFAGIFLPHQNPFDPKLGNYFSEHMFNFSINSLRNDPRVHSEDSIAEFVAQYSKNISVNYEFWNLSQGANHFYVCCHSVGRDAASKFVELQKNAVQVVCSSSYYHRYYVSHKDVALPQVWPRLPETILVPPHKRTRLVFFAGRGQNSRIRQQLMSMWENDSTMDISSGNLRNSYDEGFRKSKYCLHVKGYEVNTARISDAIHFGCVPVIISNHYDLPFANVLDWSKFSIVDHNSVVKAIYNGSEFLETASAGEEVGIVLETTSFYAEQGGQVFPSAF